MTIQHFQKTNLENLSILNELPADYDAVEKMSELAFGPGRFSRSAFRLREGVPHEEALSFTARDLDNQLVGSVRLTKILVGERVAILLGPLVVTSAYKNQGLGGVLMQTAIDAAKQAGHELVLLVGDYPYYKRFGFQQVAYGKITMPAPVAADRLLIYELFEGAAAKFSGEASRFLDVEK